jgi:glycosyltransferase involved in cell wall biosynthesis
MTVLLISSDSVDAQMAGPGIRYWEFAKHLSKTYEVILLTPNSSSLSHPRFQILQRTKHTLADSFRKADVVVTQGYLYPLAPLIMRDKPLVVDLYDPLPIELLEHHSHLPLSTAQLSQSYCVARTKMLLQRGDFLLYSNERQRDYWLGMLTAVGRVNHQQYRNEPNFTKLFGYVPYGIPDDPPVHTQFVLRGKDAMFSETDTIVLWGGGLWKWFDPYSVIRAIGEISQIRHDIKLLFLAARRSKTDSTGINIAYSTDEAIELAQQLNLYNHSVFFHHEWVPYAERQNYFLEANIGISTHFETLETRFAFRTRLLEYLWTELPIITAKGDYLSDLVEQHQLGIVVSPSSIQQIKAAIIRLTDDRPFLNQCRENIRRVRKQFFWSQVIKPLEAFCSQPYQTCYLTRFARWFHLMKFYANTGKDLIKYRGHKKILAKIRRLLNVEYSMLNVK